MKYGVNFYLIKNLIKILGYCQAIPGIDRYVLDQQNTLFTIVIFLNYGIHSYGGSRL
jgi:hypothetical protein